MREHVIAEHIGCLCSPVADEMSALELELTSLFLSVSFDPFERGALHVVLVWNFIMVTRRLKLEFTLVQRFHASKAGSPNHLSSMNSS